MTRPLGVVVTGGSTGLGLAMARLFLLAGDRVVICGRDHDRLEAALGQLRTEASGGEVYGMACDVSAPGEAQAFVSYAVSKLGVIDRWINNAGTAGRFKRPLWELAPDDIDETCRTNLCGTMMLCAEVVRVMLRQPFGGTEPSFHIFNMGLSLSGNFRGFPATPKILVKSAICVALRVTPCHAIFFTVLTRCLLFDGAYG